MTPLEKELIERCNKSALLLGMAWGLLNESTHKDHEMFINLKRCIEELYYK